MYRIRFHGRGGQGIKTASRVLGSAFFAEGFEVQDAPRYGAERRGAPLFAYVRADRCPIFERGPIDRPDLVVVADESLVQVPAAGVLVGLAEGGVLLIVSSASEATWRERLGLTGTILTLPPDPGDDPTWTALVGAVSVGAAARAIGAISPGALASAFQSELEGFSTEIVARNIERARKSFDAFEGVEGCVKEGGEPDRSSAGVPAWIRLEVEPTRVSAPDIHGGATSEKVSTGLWRTMRPEIDRSLCRRCSWICSTLCPDAAIDVGANREPRIDYDHCKGCLVCAAVCPTHAIRVEPEASAVPVVPRATDASTSGSDTDRGSMS
jgi:pyruvate ferredoxin oxidoreductase gamma subunit